MEPLDSPKANTLSWALILFRGISPGNNKYLVQPVLSLTVPFLFFMNTTALHQDLLPHYSSPIPLIKSGLSEADETVEKILNASTGIGAIGISYNVTREGKLDFICLATCTSVHLIRCAGNRAPKRGAFEALLAGENEDYSPLVGFHMARTAIQVAQTTKLRVAGVDLSRQFASNSSNAQTPGEVIRDMVYGGANIWNISLCWKVASGDEDDNVALQAWLAACVGDRNKLSIPLCTAAVDTRYLNITKRSVLARLIAQLDLFERAKSWVNKNDFHNGEVEKDGTFRLHNARFKTRVRQSHQTRVLVEDENGSEFSGRAAGVKGKQTTLAFEDRVPSAPLRSVTVFGREEATNSEKACDALIFLVLAGKDDLFKSPFTQMVWFPNERDTAPDIPDTPAFGYTIVQPTALAHLNSSQRRAVQSMIGPEPLVIVHGPPGTGKTTTIAAAAHFWQGRSSPAWIVAYSNVAVKNIANTLAKKGVSFKLLVSKEFYEEWHEHLYEEVEHNLIRSDELPPTPYEVEKLIGEDHIVLSTLSMLSNPALHDCGMYKFIPVERLVIDEASQINIFEYMHLFHRFSRSLVKACFFGDPEQLPPYGKSEVASVQTIFDVKHLMRGSANVFLDTQYRIPYPIGNFISRFVYDGLLQSQHDIHTSDCLAFVEAGQTGEQKVGNSYRNAGEVDAIVNLVRNYYKSKEFCIITPYDAQRAAIQSALERENLPWETVFNLDSFQGNEAAFVLVSVVRSSSPGFLTSYQRMNVMLTRCRKGMVIISSQEFLCGSGQSTLLGSLLAHWKRTYANSWPWNDWREISAGTASLPGTISTSQASRVLSSTPPMAAMTRLVGPLDSPNQDRLVEVGTSSRAPEGPSAGVSASFPSQTTSSTSSSWNTVLKNSSPVRKAVQRQNTPPVSHVPAHISSPAWLPIPSRAVSTRSDSLSMRLKNLTLVMNPVEDTPPVSPIVNSASPPVWPSLPSRLQSADATNTLAPKSTPVAREVSRSKGNKKAMPVKHKRAGSGIIRSITVHDPSSSSLTRVPK